MKYLTTWGITLALVFGLSTAALAQSVAPVPSAKPDITIHKTEVKTEQVPSSSPSSSTTLSVDNQTLIIGGIVVLGLTLLLIAAAKPTTVVR
jgi:hypothetical protein